MDDEAAAVPKGSKGVCADELLDDALETRCSEMLHVFWVGMILRASLRVCVLTMMLAALLLALCRMRAYHFDGVCVLMVLTVEWKDGNGD